MSKKSFLVQVLRDILFIIILPMFLLILTPDLLFCTDVSDQAKFRIVVFTPTTENNTYWPEVHSIMYSAASDLDVDLEIFEFDVLDRFFRVSEGVKILTTEPLPDAAIFSVEFGQALPLMNAAEQLKIPFYLNGPVFPEELLELGQNPGQKYKYWVGYFCEDEEMKGYLLAQKLIDAARESNSDKSNNFVYIAGINGNRSWYGSILREAGLRRAVDENFDVQLLQMVYTRWTPEEGHNMASLLLRRYPNISALWAASDQLAIGVAEALSNELKTEGSVVYTGGLDLSGTGIDSVLQGELLATVASTQLLWAQVIIDLYDYLEGLDVSSYTDSVMMFPPIVATRVTAEYIQEAIRNFDAINFLQFSRFHYGSSARRLSDIMGDL